jgi:hypothetical protein
MSLRKSPELTPHLLAAARDNAQHSPGPRESAGEPRHQELLRLLDAEIAYVQEEFDYAEKVNEERAAIERDTALAPAISANLRRSAGPEGTESH